MAPCSAARTHPTLRTLLVCMYRTQTFSSELETFFTELAQVLITRGALQTRISASMYCSGTAGNDHVIITINNMNLEKLFGIPFA